MLDPLHVQWALILPLEGVFPGQIGLGGGAGISPPLNISVLPLIIGDEFGPMTIEGPNSLKSVPLGSTVGTASRCRSVHCRDDGWGNGCWSSYYRSMAATKAVTKAELAKLSTFLMFVVLTSS